MKPILKKLGRSHLPYIALIFGVIACATTTPPVEHLEPSKGVGVKDEGAEVLKKAIVLLERSDFKITSKESDRITAVSKNYSFTAWVVKNWWGACKINWLLHRNPNINPNIHIQGGKTARNSCDTFLESLKQAL